MRTRYFLAIVTLLAVCAVAVPLEKPRAEGDKYVFFLPISQGMSGGGFSKMITKIVEKLSVVTGYDIKYVEDAYEYGYNVNDRVLKRLENGDADMTYANALGYVREREKWDSLFRPAFTIMMNNTNYSEYCMYVPSDSDIKDVAGTEGMVWGGLKTVPTRLILHENGIDKPLDEFYSDVKLVNESPVTNFIEAQANGEIEVFTAIKGQMEMSGGAPGSVKNDGKSTYRELTCTEGDLGWIFGFNKDVPPEVEATLMTQLLRAHERNNKDFAEFGFMFMAIKGRFVKYEEKYLKRTKEIVKLMEENGWDKEEEKFSRKALKKE